MTTRAISVDARALRPPLTGVGVYTLALVEAIEADGVRVTRVAERESRLPDAVYNETLLPKEPLCPVHWAPLAQVPRLRRIPGVRIVSTVHDVIEIDPDAQLTTRHRLSRRNAHSATARRADAIVATGEWAARVYEEAYGRSVDAIVSPGIDYAPASSADIDNLSESHPALEQPFALMIGSTTAQKNYPRALRGASIAGVPIVRVGPPVEGDAGVIFSQHQAAGRLYDLGYVTRAQKNALLELASVLLYPSLTEGFGLPLLDARASGCPIVTSDREPMRTNSGPASFLCDPLDPFSIAAALHEAVSGGRKEPERLPGWGDSARTLLRTMEL